MKIKNKFVSNSSTSSFVCDVCGNTEAGRDCGPGDFNMAECENGHIFCFDHIKEEKVKNYIREKKIEVLLSAVEKYSDIDVRRKLYEKMSDEEVDLAFEDFLDESEFELNCPICLFYAINKEDAFYILAEELGLTKSGLLDKLHRKYTNYKDLRTEVKLLAKNFEIE